MKLSWTREALNRLIEIEEFIARDSPSRADDFIDYLLERVSLIPDNPEIGRIGPEISNIAIRELLIKNYRLVYRIKTTVIEIITVFEGHRLLRRDEILNVPEG
jgi:plasmid stabilization system protein ParE